MADDDWLADRQIEQQHTGGGRCDECGPAGGCVVLLGAVRRRTAPRPRGNTVTAVLLSGAQPMDGAAG